MFVPMWIALVRELVRIESSFKTYKRPPLVQIALRGVFSCASAVLSVPEWLVLYLFYPHEHVSKTFRLCVMI